MNQEIINEIGLNLKIKNEQVLETLTLLSEGNTIPFIARYRKERTGNLDEEQIRAINEVYEYQVNLLKRKEDVIRLIEEKDLMTEELRTEILKATKLVEVEDLYRPFKEKKKTKATEAIKQGLEPLAKLIMEFPTTGDIETITKPFIKDTVKTVEDAVTGAGYIIAENISDNAHYRKWIRINSFIHGSIVSNIKKGVVDENKLYEIYYDYQENVKQIKPHRVLAINRGEKEKVLTVKLDVNQDEIINYLNSKIIKNEKSFVTDIVKEAIIDSYKRLIAPSIEREIRSDLTLVAEDVAIDNFGKNLESLLLQAPLKDKMILALDPAFRTGCKIAVIDYTGKKIDIKVIYPHEPRKEIEKSKQTMLDLIKKYKIDIIAIGNGTASRESEAFVAELIKEADHKVEYIIVSEAGASVYSASKLAALEFPDLHVEERSAISIGRRLQDPLSELVKIDPKSIGVGLYQHDVSDKKLTESLDFVVTKAVNQVGVNINTASSSLLKYVSGINKRNIEKIIEYRDKYGKIKSREEIINKKLISDKTYVQAVGFLRVIDGTNPLDTTDIHPESYEVARQLLKELGLTEDSIGSDELTQNLKLINLDEYMVKLKTDKYTLEDIITSLTKPNRDPRDMMEKPLLKSDILKLEDLTVGMKLQGTVRNVVDFGVFIDIGLDNDGLAHISKLTERYIKHPSEVVSVGDIVDCYVNQIHEDKQKVSLSLVKNK
ncbi:MAG: Tex family protein [Bacilli bacterium]|nr:Tex family protein [Bacilli bacterium]MDD4282985.1 Tex family protein [Bacilli bacterium]MDD4718500.1 Tex family protein [Bacilli bacterium]